MIRWALCILFLANMSTAFGAVLPSTISEKEFQSYQELAQTKLDAARASAKKDMQSLQTRLDNQDKRLDDQQSRISDIGLYISLFGILITLVVAALGLIGYFSVRNRAREEARMESKKWFDEQAQSLTQTISGFEEQLASQKQNLDQQVNLHSADMRAKTTDFMDLVESRKKNLQNEMLQSHTSIEFKPVISATSPAAHALDEVANQLRNKPESSYSFEDWNNRAFAALQANQLEEAAYFWQRASEISIADSYDIANALYNRGITLTQLGRSEDAIAVYSEFLARFGNVTELPLLKSVAIAQFNKGVELGKLERSDEAIGVYNDLLVRFGDTTDLPFREFVERALHNKGARLGQLGRNEEAITIYDDLLARLGDAANLPARELVAKTLFNKGIALSNLERSEEAIAVYNDLQSRFDNAVESTLVEHVANALFNKGIRLGKLERNEESLTAFNSFLTRFENSAELPLRAQVAWVYVNKGAQLYQLGRIEEAVAVYDDFLTRFDKDSDPSLREQVAKILANKSIYLSQLGRYNEGIATCDDMLARFNDATEKPLRDSVAVALTNKGIAMCRIAKAQWNDTSMRASNLSSAAKCFVASLNKSDSSELRWITLGYQAYSAALSGEPESQIEGLLHQALLLGCSSLYQNSLSDLEISPVPEDANFRLLLDAVWEEVKPQCRAREFI